MKKRDTNLQEILERFGKAISHGAVGGVRAVLGGGKFKAGFMSGSFAQFSSQVTANIEGPGGYAVSSLGGGIGAKLAGGDFGEGAITGAIGRALNDSLSHGTAHKGSGLGFGERVGRFFGRIGDGFREIGNSFGWHANVKAGLGAGVRFGNTRFGFDVGYETSGLGADSFGEYVSDPGWDASAGLSLGNMQLGDLSSTPRDYSWDNLGSLQPLENPNIISFSVNPFVAQLGFSINTHYHDRAASIFGDAFRNF